MSKKLSKSVCRQLAIGLLYFTATGARAANVSLDTIYTGAAIGQAASNGIIISSYAYFVSGSNLTLQGSSGYITTASSITASSFFGDGCQLGGVSLLCAPLTFTGADTFTSNFTVQSNGQPIILSTGTTIANISIASSGALSFSPALHNSSSTVIPAYTAGPTGPTYLGPCVTGSTLTITTTGGRVELVFSGALEGMGGNVVISFLQDGDFVGSLSSTTGIGLVTDSLAVTMPFFYLLDAPSPGQHSYCVTLAQTGGSGYSLINNFYTTNEFYAVEIK